MYHTPLRSSSKGTPSVPAIQDYVEVCLDFKYFDRLSLHWFVTEKWQQTVQKSGNVYTFSFTNMLTKRIKYVSVWRVKIWQKYKKSKNVLSLGNVNLATKTWTNCTQNIATYSLTSHLFGDYNRWYICIITLQATV